MRTTPDDTEIIVVMNNADADELDITINYPRVRTLKVAENLGHAAAANMGAAAAMGKYLIFTDHDVIFTDGWLEAVRTLHAHAPAVGAAGLRIVNPHTRRVLDFGIGFTRLNAPHPHLDQRLDSPLVGRSRRVQAMCSGGMLIERTLFNRLDGFDVELGNFYTDIDLCLRLKDFDRECWVASRADAYHFGGDFSQVERDYKDGHLKADIKAWFRAKNDARVEIDMQRYYDASWRAFVAAGHRAADVYVGCCLINVADPRWYVDLMKQYLNIVDVAIVPSRRRDAAIEGLYERLGYDYLTLRAPIVYFVDRFVSLGNNDLWWESRADNRDLVVDRHGNIMRVADI